MFLKIGKTCDNIWARLSDDAGVFNYNLWKILMNQVAIRFGVLVLMQRPVNGWD